MTAKTTQPVLTIPVERIKRLNREAGQHWFDPGTMRFFQSRVALRAYLGPFPAKLAYFVSSEVGPSGVRRYSVRVADLASGRVNTVPTFQEYAHRSTADRAARRLATGMPDQELGYHFLQPGGLLRGGTKPPRSGRWLTYNGTPKLCARGLHGSRRALHALQYAQSAIVCRVEFDGITAEEQGDKLVCTRRKILWRMDATETLRAFARRCALDVIHLWDAPEVVRRYLETGDESIRTAARDAAWDAAWDAKNATYADWLDEMLEVAHAAQ